MSGRSKTSIPMISRDLFSATSSRELASGALLCVWPDGRITEKYGREVAPASLSPRQAKALGLMTSGTYGPPSNGSFEKSRAMSLSLASKLRAATDCIGSTLYRLTWKDRVTPSGRSIPALRASALRISGNAFTGWPTPIAEKKDHGKYDDPAIQRRIRIGKQLNLGMLVGCAGWPTPKAATGGPDFAIFDRPNTGSASPATVATFALHPSPAIPLAGWPTPQAGSPGTENYNPGGNTDSSRKTTAIAATVEYRFTPSTIGEMPNGSSVVIPTARASGPLNPAHSLWLMLGPYATDWLRCAERVTLSTSRKRKAS